MDEYLVFDASFKRLLKEYEQYGSLVIAVDFDNTLYDFHKVGATYNMVTELIRELKKINCYIIVFTANEDYQLIHNYMLSNSIPYNAVNENPPFFKCDARKIYYNCLIDDRSGLYQTYSELKQLVQTIKNK